MNINDFINHFEYRNNKIRNHKMDLPDGVLAYRLLKSANLTVETQQLTQSTLSEITYDNMKKTVEGYFRSTWLCQSGRRVYYKN